MITTKQAKKCKGSGNEILSNSKFSTGFEEEDCHLAKVEVDKVSCLVGDVGPEVPSNNAVPGGVVLLVKLLEPE